MTSIVNVTPDFELLVNQLTQRLALTDTWKDLYVTNMGQTVIDMFAAAGVTNQFQIELGLREAFLITALRESSVLASTRSLGVRVSRKTSASLLARLVNDTPNALFIPPYSKFLVADIPYYNKNQLVFGPNQELNNIQLFEGEVNTFNVDIDTLSDRNYYEAVLDSEAYSVADNDLLVYTTNKHTQTLRMFNKTDKALWEHGPDDYIYFENTNNEGKPSLIFGDGTNGALLPISSILSIRYIVTSGASGNGRMPGAAVVYAQQPAVAGSTTSASEGGADQKKAAYYKKFAPYLFRSKRRIISQSDYRAAIATYPGVADAYIMGQRDIAPKELSWMTVVRVCVLPENTDTLGGANPNPRSPAWEQFRAWLNERIHTCTVIQTWNPEKILTNIHLRVAINPAANASEISLQITENLLALFEKKPGILGRKLTLSDIHEAAKKVPGVDYIDILEPVKTIEPSGMTQYVALQTMPRIDVVHTDRVVSNV